MTIFRFALQRIFRNRINLFFLTLFPIVCIFFPQGETWPFLPYGYQYFGIFILFVGIRLASIILEDREKGVDKRLAVAPIRHAHYLTQNLLAYSVIVIAQCFIVVYGGILAGQELHKPHWLFVLFVSFSFTSVATALAWISIFRSREVSFLVYMSIIFLIAVLGGLMMPVIMFPEWLKQIAVVFPTFWLSEGLEWIVFGETIADFLLINGVLWLYGIVFMIIGSMRKIH